MKKLLLSISFFGGLMASAQTPCSELFISEYVEGSGNDKALEIYNPTANAIDLTGYRIERFQMDKQLQPVPLVLMLVAC